MLTERWRTEPSYSFTDMRILSDLLGDFVVLFSWHCPIGLFGLAKFERVGMGLVFILIIFK